VPDSHAVCPRDGTPVDMTPSLRATLGQKYEIIRELGRGGAGVVYKAKQRYLDKVCAIKVLLSEHLPPEQIARFHKEAVALSKLQHPNLISLLDFGVTEDHIPYMVMDFIDGITLTEMISKQRFLSPSLIVDVGIQLARAMSYAHHQGVLHRDLKPGNVMIVYPQSRTSLTAYILDFGIAKMAEDKKVDSSLTKTGEVFGSPLYMSPEQAQGKRVDERTDVYSLGCIMYEALSGRPPFVGDNPLDVMIQKLQDTPPDLSKLKDKSIPAALSSIVSTALQRDPDKRFRDMQAFERALNRWRSTGLGVLIWDRKLSQEFLVWTAVVLTVVLVAVGCTAYFLSISQVDKKVQAAVVPPMPAPEDVELGEATVQTMVRNEMGESLNISSRPVSDGDLTGLARKYNLRKLMIGGIKQHPMDITDRSIGYFTNLPLRDLAIHYAPHVTDACMKQIAAMKMLNNLVLRNVPLSNRGMTDLEPLAQQLTALNVGSTNLTDASAPTIAKFSKVMDLHIDGDKFTAAGLRELAPLKNLVCLDISYTQVEPAKLTLLSQFPNLEDLGVRRLNLTDDSIAALAKLPKLAKLDISQNRNLTEEALKKLTSCRSLRNLIAIQCYFHQQDVDLFKKNRPDVDVDVTADSAAPRVDQMHWEQLDNPLGPAPKAN
jgi:serine/threonine protein kinase